MKKVRDVYGPAMDITDEAEAERYLEQLIADCMAGTGLTYEQADAIQRKNIGISDIATAPL